MRVFEKLDDTDELDARDKIEWWRFNEDKLLIV